MSSTAGPVPVAKRTDLAHWVIRVASAVYVIGLVLLGAAVYVDLPGFLAAYGDPEAWWPILVQVLAGGTAFITWMRVNRRSNRPFAVVLLGLGILTVVALAIPSYSACPDAHLSAGWSVITRVVGLVTNNYAIDQFNPATTTCEIGGVPLALQFARLAQLLVLLVAFTSAVTALLRSQVDRVRVRWSPRLSVVLGADTTSAPLLPALAADAGRYTLAVLTSDPLAPWVGQARAAGWRVVVTDPRRVETMVRLLGRPRPAARAAPAGRARARQHRVAAADVGGADRDRRSPDGDRQPPRARPAPDGRGVAGRGLAAPLPEPDPGLDRRHDQRERGHRPATRRPHGRAGRRPGAARRPVRPDLRGGGRARPARPRARARPAAGRRWPG